MSFAERLAQVAVIVIVCPFILFGLARAECRGDLFTGEVSP